MVTLADSLILPDESYRVGERFGSADGENE